MDFFLAYLTGRARLQSVAVAQPHILAASD